MTTARAAAERYRSSVRDYPTDGPLPPGSITTDTQLALFTAQGLIRAGIRRDRGLGLTVAVVHEAYDHWLDTQLRPEPAPDAVGPLGRQPWLHRRRDPGRTTPAALTADRRAGPRYGHLVGARHGETAPPPELVFRLEGRGTILDLADDLAFEFTRSERLHGDHGPETGWRQRYS